MKSSDQTSTLEWIQAKYGIAILFAGCCAIAVDHGNAERYLLGPVAGGLLVVLLALLSKKILRYHFTPLQLNTGIFLLLFYWAGFWTAVCNMNSTPVHVHSAMLKFWVIVVSALSYLAVFFTSCAYQDEMEEMENRLEGK